jgi:hypothetical protein
MTQYSFRKRLLILALIFALIVADSAISHAAVTFNHQMKILNLQGTPITTAVDIRISLWTSADYITSDVNGSGVINTGAATYVYQEEHTSVTPSQYGVVSLEVGEINALPNPLPETVFIQVEIKNAGTALTSYDLMDSNPADVTKDRAKSSGALSAVTSQLQSGLGGLSQDDIFDGTPGEDIAGIKVYRIGETANTATTNIELRFGNDASTKLLEWVSSENLFRFGEVVDFASGLKIGNIANSAAGFSALIGVDSSLLVNSAGLNLQDVLEDFDIALGLAGGGAVPKTYVIAGGSGTPHIHADGSTNVINLYSENDAVANKNLYVGNSGEVTLNDINLVHEWAIPTGFVSFQATPLIFSYKTDTGSATDNYISLIAIRDTTGAAVTFTGGTNLTNAGAWATESITFTSVPTATPGDSFQFEFQIGSKNSNNAYLGELKINYNG